MAAGRKTKAWMWRDQVLGAIPSVEEDERLAAATGVVGEDDFAVDLRQRQIARDGGEGEHALQSGRHRGEGTQR
jgi:hypothetical protein